MSEFAEFFTKKDYENDLALITADALALAYRMLDCIPEALKRREGFANALEEIVTQYRKALKSASSIAIPKRLEPAMKQFSGKLVDTLKPFFESLSEPVKEEDKTR